MANVKAELRAASDSVCAAVAAGDANKWAQIFTDDAVLIADGNKVFKGKDGVLENAKSVIGAGITKVTCDDSCYEAGQLGDGVGWHSGHWEGFNNAGAKVVVFKDLVIWKKVAGSWKVFRELRVKM